MKNGSSYNQNDNVVNETRENNETFLTGLVLRLELEGLDSTQYPLLTLPIELSVETQFHSWDIAEYYLKEYGRQNGFVVNRYRVEYHKNLSSDLTEHVKKRTLTCEKAGKYKPNKLKPIGQQCNKSLKKTDCKRHINLNNPKGTDHVYITFVQLEHNHSINADNVKFAPTFRKFNEDVMSEIEHAVVKIVGSDASHLLNFLLNQQKEDPTMFIQPLINPDSDRLSGIFWMTANQIMLWSRYSDVILHDNMARTNKYNYPLSLFILVNCNGKSRLGAQAFLNDETQESYEWVLQQTLDATGIEPQVILTDMDPAMDVACQSVYKNTYHIHCIWHLSQNLIKRLKSKLGVANFKMFINDFWKARNSLCVDVFKQRFQSLLEKYPSAYEYLYSTIYSSRQSWTWLFINRIFTAGMQSTQ
ncbi:unnamed protein product [Rhizophagus irregularis]|nr:unnamed protein product [Rhizophagus irregularis]